MDFLIKVVKIFFQNTGIKSVTKSFPTMKMLTSEIHQVAPNHFGQKYFGTE